MILSAQNLSLPGRLDLASAAFAPGRVTAICGPNGAGKSSLLACLAGILAPTSGIVELGGTNLTEMNPRSRAQALGLLPQQAEAAWDLSVETLVGLGRLPWDEGVAKDRAAVDAALSAMHLDALRTTPLSRLSGGQRARALLARVLAGTPRWLLADEPLANLDLAHQLALLAHLRGLAAQGMGVVLVLHDLAQAMNYADQVSVMVGGQVLHQGAPDKVLDQDNLREVWGIDARWLGDPGQRALNARLTSNRAP
jgi:iron complex transport system ATP-binding protein